MKRLFLLVALTLAAVGALSATQVVSLALENGGNFFLTPGSSQDWYGTIYNGSSYWLAVQSTNFQPDPTVGSYLDQTLAVGPIAPGGDSGSVLLANFVANSQDPGPTGANIGAIVLVYDLSDGDPRVGGTSYESGLTVQAAATVTVGDSPTVPVVPEPATFGLMALGAVAVGLTRRFRRV